MSSCYAHLGLNCDCESCSSLTQEEYEKVKAYEKLVRREE